MIEAAAALKTLTIEQVNQIAADAEAVATHWRAGHKALGIGSIFTAADIDRAEKAGSYDCPERARLEAAVLALSPEGLAELTALMYVGRGDWDGDDPAEQNFVDHLHDARQAIRGDAEHARYVLDKDPLGEYLRSGLKKLGWAS